MKTKKQKREEAIQRILVEIKEIEAKPADQRNEVRLAWLKSGYRYLKGIK